MKFSQRKPGAALPVGKSVMVWGAVLGVAILAFVWNLITIFRDAGADAAYQKVVSNLRVVSQRADASAREAVAGRTEAFAVLTKARQDFGNELGVLANGRDDLASPRELLGEQLTGLGPRSMPPSARSRTGSPVSACSPKRPPRWARPSPRYSSGPRKWWSP